VSAAVRLVDRYDLVIFDLDGVVYLGHEPIAGAIDAINDLARRGPAVAYATNNASRRADEVSGLLTSLGIDAKPSEVVTSAQASARLLADRLAPGTDVLIVGGPALRAEISDVGLRPVISADAKPAAVVQGYAADVGWSQLAEACIAVRNGALWVATNPDTTLPSPRGPLPGNGALVAALRTALGRDPDEIVGKPAPQLFRDAADRAGAKLSLVVGDRLDTDIEGANHSGMDSMLVMTGVTDAAALRNAPAGLRPTYLAADLSALGDASRAVTLPANARDKREWAAAVDGALRQAGVE
jgi:glycerol-1-phosphatase